jgi:hypothetical protein
MLRRRPIIGIAFAASALLACQNREPASLLESCVRAVAIGTKQEGESVTLECDVLVDSVVIAVPAGAIDADAFVRLGLPREAVPSVSTALRPAWCVLESYPPKGDPKPGEADKQLRYAAGCASSSLAIDTPLLAHGRNLKVTVRVDKVKPRLLALEGRRSDGR